MEGCQNTLISFVCYTSLYFFSHTLGLYSNACKCWTRVYLLLFCGFLGLGVSKVSVDGDGCCSMGATII